MSERREGPETKRTATEMAGRVFFLLAGGVLLGILVSCACGPIR